MDNYQYNFEKSKKSLQECQKKMNLKSCYPCEKWESCKVRKEYVKATYENMSKGNHDGGFEF